MRLSAILLVITEALTGSDLDLQESPWVFELFGKQPRHCVHLGFALTVDEESDQGGRRRPAQRLVEAPLLVRFAHRIRPDAAPADVRDAHDLAERVGDILDLIEHPGFTVFAESAKHRTAGDGTYRITDLTYQLRYLRTSKVDHP